MRSAAAVQAVKAGAVACFVLLLDQGVKEWVRADVIVGERIHLLPLVSVVHTTNTGIAFGFLGGTRGWLIPLLTAVAVIAVSIWFWSRPSRTMAWLPTGLILGGAAGNLLDRARFGAVTDFVKLPHWPAFNVADISITVGVILLIAITEIDARRAGN